MSTILFLWTILGFMLFAHAAYTIDEPTTGQTVLLIVIGGPIVWMLFVVAITWELAKRWK